MVDRIRLLYRQTHELEQQLAHPHHDERLAGAMQVSINKVEWMRSRGCCGWKPVVKTKKTANWACL